MRARRPSRRAPTRPRHPRPASVLHDGNLCGTWRMERDDATATLMVRHVERLSKRALASLAAEGRRLSRFVAADAERHDVRFESP